MMRSMFASVSGLKVHQTKMDVIGNNISNVNTLGYKGSRATFKETLSQTMRNATAPDEERGTGGTNPVQVGLGVDLGSIDADMSSGNLQPTGKQSDVAIQGDGLFIVNDGSQDYYTRAGSFSFDKEGYLFNSSNGYRVQGWKAEEDGSLNNIGPDNIGDIMLDKTMNPDQTENVSFNGNLNMAEKNKFTFNPNKIKVTDGGISDNLSIDLSETSDYNTYDFELTGNSTTTFNVGGSNVLTGTIELDHEGNVVNLTGDDGAATVDLTTPGALEVDLGTGPITLDLPAAGDNMKNTPFIAEIDTAGTQVEEMGSRYELNAKRTVSVDVFDSMGKQHSVNLDFAKTDHNRWLIKEDNITVSDGTEPAAGFLNGNDHVVAFDKDGNVVDGENLNLSFEPHGGLDVQQLNLDFSDISQYAGNMTADFSDLDGYPVGEFQSLAIDTGGNISGSFSNGQSKVLGKIGLAMFSNPSGLAKEDGLMTESNNSGQARVGIPGVNGRGKLAPGSLEMSNVDLAEQFTEMISSQRGFQASSKLITTSDEMLQQLVNMKR